MSVQKSDILTFVIEKLLLKSSTAVADILIEIQSVLDDLSKMAKWPVLYRSNVTADQATLSSGDTSVSFPSGLRVLDKIVLNDGTNDGRPLTEITFDQWLKRREDESSSGYDEPKEYARRGNSWYPDPIPDDTGFTVKYWYWRHHPTVAAATDDILFGNEFENVINYGVCAEVAKTNKRTQDIMIWEPRYENEKRKMRPGEDRDITVAQYHDL